MYWTFVFDALHIALLILLYAILTLELFKLWVWGQRGPRAQPDHPAAQRDQLAQQELAKRGLRVRLVKLE
jgi:hypothetical protein